MVTIKHGLFTKWNIVTRMRNWEKFCCFNPAGSSKIPNISFNSELVKLTTCRGEKESNLVKKLIFPVESQQMKKDT